MDVPPSLLTLCGVRVIAASGIFSPLLLALHLSGGGRKAWRQGEGQMRERERETEACERAIQFKNILVSAIPTLKIRKNTVKEEGFLQ